jgi:predicted lipid carrier protein YhbT
MSTRLMRALPGALALRRTTLPVAGVRFVLTGAAGGCYDVAFDTDAPTGTAMTIVADTLDLCRVAARRLSADALDVTIEGDTSAAASLLGALDAFARD